MTDVHFSYSELSGLGQQIVDHAVDALQTHRMTGFTSGIPAAPGYHPVPSKAPPPPPLDLNYARNLLADIPTLFGSFAGPDPASCGAVCGQVNAIRQALGDNIPTQDEDQAPSGSWRPSPALSPTLTRIDSQSGDDHWKGLGKDAFTAYMGNLWHPDGIIEHQKNLGTVLTVGMRAHQKILDWAYQDIWSIGQETINVLDAGGTGGCHAPSGNVVLQIVSGIAWVAAAIATDGASVALTALAAATGSLGGFLPPEKQTAVHGTTMLTVISSMCDAISKLLDAISKQQTLVVDQLTAAAKTAGVWYHNSPHVNAAGLYPPSPAGFADANGWTPI